MQEIGSCERIDEKYTKRNDHTKNQTREHQVPVSFSNESVCNRDHWWPSHTAIHCRLCAGMMFFTQARDRSKIIRDFLRDLTRKTTLPPEALFLTSVTGRSHGGSHGAFFSPFNAHFGPVLWKHWNNAKKVTLSWPSLMTWTASGTASISQLEEVYSNANTSSSWSPERSRRQSRLLHRSGN